MTDKEINALIAEKVMGYEPDEKRYNFKHPKLGWFCIDDWCPCEDIAAAWEVVDRIGWFFKLFSWEIQDGTWFALFKDPKPHNNHIDYDCLSTSAPMAICLAALKTKGVEIES